MSTAEGMSAPGDGNTRLALQILGATRVWRDGVEVDPGPRQQVYLLTLLLARAGGPVSTSQLIDLIWGDDMPRSAMNIVQKYVGALRRVLEPTLSARAAGSYIHRHSSGYRFDPGNVSLDLAEFRDLVSRARHAVAGQRAEDAVAAYEQALGKWHGPAGDGLTAEADAVPLFASVNRELFDACLEAARVAVPLGQAKRILQPLRLASWIAPYDETIQATLMIALAGAGQQSEALSVFDTVRTRLADELGVDPGQTLREAHQQVLVRAETTSSSRSLERLPDLPMSVEANLDGTGDTDRSSRARQPGRLVGRRAELALLRHAVDSATFSRPQVVVVEGPPGVGKSRLLHEVVEDARDQGAFTAWGRCQDGEGAPALSPWIQIVRMMMSAVPEDQAGRWMTTELGALLKQSFDAPPGRPDPRAHFRLCEQVISLAATVAAKQSVVVVVDDLHWADQASLQLFLQLAQSLPARCVLAGALRDYAPAPHEELQRLLAALARQDGHRRVVLGPLEPTDVAELVRREIGQTPTPGVARSIQARTEGNPFFVVELARFMADGGDLTDDHAAQAAVPATVRDIVRDRMSRLDDEERRLIAIAAVMGRDIDVRLLSRAAGVDPSLCLKYLETLQTHDLLRVSSDAVGDWRFAHDLVRESVVRSTPISDTSRLHLQAADALESVATHNETRAEALAHHLLAAGPLADAARTAEALIVAGRIAARRSAYDVAEKDLDIAAGVARNAGLAELELTALTELTAITGIHAGFVGSTMDHLDRAETIARSLGREREATGFLFSRFLAHAQGLRVQTAGGLARRLLDNGRRSTDPVVQASGHHAWGVYQWSSGNVGAAYRSLNRSAALIQAEREAEPLRFRLQMLTPVMLALNTALHGDLATAREEFGNIEASAGNDPYAISIWGSFSVTAAAAAGDHDWALRAAETAIALDPDFTFSFSGSYIRLARLWALAMSGADPAAVGAKVERIIETSLVDPPRSNLATWYALLAEIQLADGNAPAAAEALDKAETFISTYGERYAEGLVLLMRARTLHSQGHPMETVRATAQEALDLSTTREAHLFATRAKTFLAELSR
ncbi:BTAD domain-containing putative transcriptional regulator [Kribbella sp. C-35]|uniref:BTAD domain-containing putative transcriptional regulator n=1 Tax=Kribbella sp. C-35 TaxID=2789276 RepID=UPI00397B6F58